MCLSLEPRAATRIAFTQFLLRPFLFPLLFPLALACAWVGFYERAGYRRHCFGFVFYTSVYTFTMYVYLCALRCESLLLASFASLFDCELARSTFTPRVSWCECARVLVNSDSSKRLMIAIFGAFVYSRWSCVICLHNTCNAMFVLVLMNDIWAFEQAHSRLNIL